MTDVAYMTDTLKLFGLYGINNVISKIPDVETGIFGHFQNFRTAILNFDYFQTVVSNLIFGKIFGLRNRGFVLDQLQF